MKIVVIDGKVVGTFKTKQPHGELRKILIDAKLNDWLVIIVKVKE